MNPLFLIPVVIFVVAAIVMIVMNKKHASAKASLHIDEFRQNPNEHQKYLLDTEFTFLKDFFASQNLEISSLTSGNLPQNNLEKMKNFFKNQSAEFFVKMLGTDLTNKSHDFYWVFANERLFFVHFERGGVISGEEVIEVDFSQFENISLEEIGKIKEVFGVYSDEATEYLPTGYKLTFSHSNGEKTDFLVYDRLVYEVNPSEYLNVEKQLSDRLKCQVVGENFLKKLQTFIK